MVQFFHIYFMIEGNLNTDLNTKLYNL